MDGVPCAEDHLRITILVRQIGPRNHTAFNRIVDRLQRQQALQVGESSQRRVVLANFVTSVNAEIAKFGEFQAHRRVVGVIGVACALPSTSHTNNIEKSPSKEIKGEDRNSHLTVRRRSSVGITVNLEDVKNNYDNLKAEHSATLVDSRCILMGYEEDECAEHFPLRELMNFPAMEDSDRLENDVREYLRNIYFVHEQKRMDVAFEKLENAPCPLLPEEEKLRVGTENKMSKTYKRKCLGRCRKQQADYTMLTGLPSLALEHYQNAIESLKSANDLLWLAGALEGWACAAISILFDETTERLEKLSGMTRVPTLTPIQMREAQETRHQHSLGISLGHQRHRSDEDTSRLSANSSDGGLSIKRRIPWVKTDRGKDKIEPSEVLERFEQALEHYGKFGFAAYLEYECMMKAVSLFRHQRKHIEMEDFHRNHVGKFLDDSFTRFDHNFKAQICSNSAQMYKKIGFNRKHAFFARLGVLFRLHVTDGDSRTVNDYRAVYPILYRTLSGYGISESSRDFSVEAGNCGPVQVQIKALHEVYTSASRAQITDAAIRHLCHLLQVYYDELESSMSSRLLGELSVLLKTRGSVHNLSQHLSLEGMGVGTSSIILPPIQMTRFPVISKAEIRALPPHLAPTVVKASTTKAIFIYCAFEKKSSEATSWVVGSHCVVTVYVYNCLPSELVVRELCLLGDGIPFEAVPVRLSLSPGGDNPRENMQKIKLIAVPRASGRLTITGYSCEVFGLKNVCKLGGATPLQVEVLPELPLLTLQTSMPRAPISSIDMDGAEPAAETTVFSGQLFSHFLTVSNSSAKISIREVRVQVRQPKVSGGPSLIEVIDEDNSLANDSTSSLTSLETDEQQPKEVAFSLGPNETRDIKFRIFGVDPAATADDENGNAKEEMKVVEYTRPPSPDTVSESPQERIPYTGRLLTCEFVFTYIADVDGPDGEQYSRTGRLPLAITIVPAVTVSEWHVLPGDGPFTRYIVVDVSNSTDSDAELIFAGTRAMSVLPRDTCRVPLLCPCCTEVAGRSFHAAQQRDSHVLQRREVERLRRTLEVHVAKHLDIRWSIPGLQLEGLVPVGALLSSVPLLKQLVLPAISLELSTNGVPYLSEDDISIGIGEVIVLRVAVISSLDYAFHGSLSLSCTQEISSRQECMERSDNLMVVGKRIVPFVVPSHPTSSSLPAPRCEMEFRLLFRCEGVHKVRPMVKALQGAQLLVDEVFVSPVSFNVSTKQRH